LKGLNTAIYSYRYDPRDKTYHYDLLKRSNCLDTRWKCVEGEKYALPLDRRVVGPLK